MLWPTQILWEENLLFQIFPYDLNVNAALLCKWFGCAPLHCSIKLCLCPQDEAFRRFLHHKVSRLVVNFFLVIFSFLFSAFHHIYVIINLTVFVFYCLLLLSQTILVIQPLGCERDINKLLLSLLLFWRIQTCSL